MVLAPGIIKLNRSLIKIRRPARQNALPLTLVNQCRFKSALLNVICSAAKILARDCRPVTINVSTKKSA